MSVELDEPRSVLWRGTGGGTVKASRVGKVWSVGCSGTVCAALRAAHRFNAYLSAIGTRPHRVTRLDATVDLKVDAAPVVAEFTRAGRAGELSLTRKKIKPADVLAYTGTRFDGAVTGTVYLGTRRADVRMVVYDKQHERISRKLIDVGPLTRYELRLKAGTGVTLRDASQPAGVFWHYAAPEFLPAPPDAPEWVAGGTGYDLPPSVPLLASQRLLRKLEGSPEVAALLALAHECGPYGVELLISHLRGRAVGGGSALPALTALQGEPSSPGIASPGATADTPTPLC
jgi:hypothetical protein